MNRTSRVAVKFGIFAFVMVLLTAALFVAFGRYRTGDVNRYSATFQDVSRLKAGDSVRVAGVQVGTVGHVTLEPDNTISVEFDADRTVVLTSSTKLAVRYLNLVGDRYLELVDSPGSSRLLAPGSRIPSERTSPALDLDLLLGGLKPVLRGLNPQDVNALTSSLVQILQGQDGAVQSLFERTASFTQSLADKGAVMQQVIDNLRTTVGTISNDSARFDASIDRLETLTRELAADRDPIGTALDSLSTGSASLSDLLTQVRPPLKGTVDQLDRLAPLLVQDDMAKVETALQRAPDNYRKLVRLGAYGSFINFYLCGISVRVSDLQQRTAVFPWVRNNGGRCADDS